MKLVGGGGGGPERGFRGGGGEIQWIWMQERARLGRVSWMEFLSKLLGRKSKLPSWNRE